MIRREDDSRLLPGTPKSQKPGRFGHYLEEITAVRAETNGGAGVSLCRSSAFATVCGGISRGFLGFVSRLSAIEVETGKESIDHLFQMASGSGSFYEFPLYFGLILKRSKLVSATVKFLLRIPS